MESYPSVMIFMHGCFIDRVEASGRVGFKITTDFKNPVTLYAASPSEADEWIIALR